MLFSELKKKKQPEYNIFYAHVTYFIWKYGHIVGENAKDEQM